MSKPTELDYLEAANANYHYIYQYAKDLDAVQLYDDEKTLFALKYLLEQFFWCINNLLNDSFRKNDPEMDNLTWLHAASAGTSSDFFSLEDVPNIIYEDLKLIEFYKTFKKVYYREKRKLISVNAENVEVEKEKTTRKKKSKSKCLPTAHPQVLWPAEKYEKKYSLPSVSRQKPKRVDENNDLPLDNSYKYPVHSQHSLWTVRKK